MLAGWDQHVNLDSRGALLFERFMDKFGDRGGAVREPVRRHRPGQHARSGSTRRTRRSSPRSRRGHRPAGASIPLDAPYGDFHIESRGAEQIPIHGGEGGQGVFNAISDVWDPTARLLRRHRRLELRDGDRVRRRRSARRTARSSPTRSRTNPNSKHYADQTRMFSQKKWVDPPFCAGQVEQTAKSVKVVRAK